MIPAVLLMLTACDLIEGDDKKVHTPEPKAESLTLHVTGGELAVVSVKNGDTEVPGKFTGLSGSFKFTDADKREELRGSLDVAIASWDSDNEIRDENVENTFFELGSYGTATFKLKSLTLPEGGIELGSSVDGDAEGTLTVHGSSIELAGKVRVSRSGKTDYHVDSVDPFVVSIESLGMSEQLQALMKLCNHKSVDDGVKVSVRVDLAGEKPRSVVDAFKGKALPTPSKQKTVPRSTGPRVKNAKTRPNH